MSDLSRLLGDVYNSAPATEPSWSSDAALEEVFADWVPGPAPDASSAERSFQEDTAAHGIEHRLDADDDDDDQLQTLLDEAARFASSVDVPDEDGGVDDAPAPLGTSGLVLLPTLDEEAEPPVDADFVPPVPVHAWSRQDDDILPGRGRRRRVSFSLNRR